MAVFSILLLVLVALGIVALIGALAAGRLPLSKLVIGAAAITMVSSALFTIVSLIDPLLNDRTTVAIPLQPFQPHPASGISLEGMTATIVGGGIDRATLTLAGLSWTVRLLLVASWTLQGATWIAVSLVAIKLARSLEQGDIFRDGSRALMQVAAIVAGGGILAAILGDLGAWWAGVEALEFHGGGADGVIATLDPFDNLAQFGWPASAGPLINIPFWPITAGLGLALIAAAFSAGHKLRQDTQGLV